MDSQIWAFVGVTALLTVTPGADTALVIRNALAFGRGSAFATVGGISAGCLTHATLSALGLSLILQQSAVAFQAVQWAGAAYLVWIGLQSILRRPTGRDKATVAATGGFRQGLLTNLLNPKVALFYLTLLPQFLSAAANNPLRQSIGLAMIHVTMGIVWLGFVALAVTRMRPLIDSGGIRRLLETVTGAALIALGIRLALARR